MTSKPETRDDSVLAELAADACRRIADGLLTYTGDELRALLSQEIESLRDAVRDPGTLRAAEDPADPPWFSRKGHTVINTNPVTSRRNPMAPLLNTKQDGERVVATTGPLSVRFQGPRGRLHGGYVGVLLDQVLWDAIYRRLGHASFTRTLTVTYEQAAPLGAELTITAWVTSVDGRKTTAEGELRCGDTVCARAEGLWVAPRPRP